MPEKWELEQMRALPLDAKVAKTKQRIREWYDYWGGDVFVSFSGGKDSTVLAHLVHSMYPDVPLVFSNTGLEYPEIQAFARKMGAEFLRPKMTFSEVISKYGYPLIGKEVAEAIHFARRIVPHDKISEGGVAEKKQTELLGNRRKKLREDSETSQERWPRKDRMELTGTRPMGRLTEFPEKDLSLRRAREINGSLSGEGSASPEMSHRPDGKIYQSGGVLLNA